MSVVTTTYLEMSSPKELRPKSSAEGPLRIEECLTNQWQQSRSYYLAVGAPWAWNDKRFWTDEQWMEYAKAPTLRTFIAHLGDQPIGYFELHTSQTNEIEISYFGLLPNFVGRRLGGPLLSAVLEMAWQQNPSRVWVHTCDLDHPAALPNYQARGMVVYEVEVHDSSLPVAQNNA